MLRGAESFGYRPAGEETDADAARAKTELFLAAIGGAAVARTDPVRTGISGGLAIQPQSPGLADRIWWGSGTRATAQWAARIGLNPKLRPIRQVIPGLTWCFAGSAGLRSGYLLQGERDRGAEELEGLPLGAGRFGEHRDGDIGAGVPDLVAGQGGQVF